MAYTYLIGWKNHNKYYYGVRFSKKSDPSELWVSYFTSSKHVKSFSEKYGTPDIIQIRKLFEDSDKARIWESKVLSRMKVVDNDNWLNKTDNKSIDPILSMKGTLSHIGKKRSEETKLKMRGPKSEKHKMNMRGKRPHVNQTGINNNAFKGYIITPYGKFESLKEAALIENVHFSTISFRLKNKSFEDYKRITV